MSPTPCRTERAGRGCKTAGLRRHGLPRKLLFAQDKAALIVSWADPGYTGPHVVLASLSDEALLSYLTRERVPDEPKTFPSSYSCFCGRPRMSRGRNSHGSKEINMTIGTVKFFNSSKGFGFIAPDDGGKDVFVHVSAVEAAGLRTLNEGQKVKFDIQPDARGSKAANLSAV